MMKKLLALLGAVLAVARCAAMPVPAFAQTTIHGPVTFSTGLTVTGSTVTATSGGGGINQLTGAVLAGPGVGSQVTTLNSACADLSDDGEGCSSTSRAANLVLAGPTTGGAAAPTFRSLVTADVTGTIACSDLTDDGAGCSATVRAANIVLAGPASGGDAAPAFRSLVALDIPATPLAAGTSVSLAAPRQYYVCTGTCTVTPPVPAAGYEFCVYNDNNKATIITFAALGSSAMYENTARTAYGTAGTGTLVSGGAVGDKACIVGRDSTHYSTTTFQGTWTAN